MNYILNKFTLFIVVSLSIVIILTFNEVGMLGQRLKQFKLAQQTGLFDEQLGLYKTQERCQEKTKYICDYRQCDTTENTATIAACGTNSKSALVATNVPIPSFYKNLRTIRLSIFQKPITSSYDINSDANAITYTVATENGTPIIQTRSAPSQRTVSLKNKMILLDFTHDRTFSTTPTALSSAALYTFYLLSQDTHTTSTSPRVEEKTLSCIETQCSHGISGIVADMKSLWNEVSVP